MGIFDFFGPKKPKDLASITVEEIKRMNASNIAPDFFTNPAYTADLANLTTDKKDIIQLIMDYKNKDNIMREVAECRKNKSVVPGSPRNQGPAAGPMPGPAPPMPAPGPMAAPGPAPMARPPMMDEDEDEEEMGMGPAGMPGGPAGMRGGGRRRKSKKSKKGKKSKKSKKIYKKSKKSKRTKGRKTRRRN
jgi:hypothetical protein